MELVITVPPAPALMFTVDGGSMKLPPATSPIAVMVMVASFASHPLVVHSARTAAPMSVTFQRDDLGVETHHG